LSFKGFYFFAANTNLLQLIGKISCNDACELLIGSDKPINEMAYQTGFDSLTYFNRIFVKKKKMNPQQFQA